MPEKNKARSAQKRTPITRDAVLAAALELADAEGSNALTMRKLADRIGVEAMSIYYHVPNKEAILTGLVDLVFAEIDLPALRCTPAQSPPGTCSCAIAGPSASWIPAATRDSPHSATTTR